MEKKSLILKTYGVHTYSKGCVILPDNFCVDVIIENNGEFSVNFIDRQEKEIFGLVHNVSAGFIHPEDKDIPRETLVAHGKEVAEQEFFHNP